MTLDFDDLRLDYDAALTLSRDLVVWRTEENFMMRTITWWAESNLFDPIPEHHNPPEYKAKVSTSSDGETTVKWIRQ